MVTSESQILADVFEDVRGLTKFYLAQAKGIDPHKSYEIDGVKLNSLYWLIAHLTWSEHYLLVEAMTGEAPPYLWMDQFQRGAPPELTAGAPDWEEVLRSFDEVHEKAMTTLRGLSDDDLATPNHHGISMRAGDAKRIIIRHAIRHEPMHAGHISWICKLAGQPMG